MRTSLSAVSGAALWLLAGCQIEAVDVSAETTQGASTTTDGGDTTGAQLPEGPALCRSLAPGQPVLALATITDGQHVSVAMSDGSVKNFPVSIEPAPQDADPSTTVVTDHGYFATVWTWTAFTPDPVAAGEARIYSPSGDLLAARPFAGAYGGSAYLGPEGDLLFVRQTADFSSFETTLVSTVGVTTVVPRFSPVGPPTREGALPGWTLAADNSPTGFGFVSREGVMLSATPEEHFGKLRVLHEDVLYTFLLEEEMLRLVTTTPTTSFVQDVLPLPDAAQPGFQFLHQQGAYLALLDSHRGATHVLHLPTAQSFEVSRALPAGTWAMDCYNAGPLLDPRGRVYRVARDEEKARVYRGGSSSQLEPIGRPVSGVDYIEARGLGASVTIQSFATGETFCPWQVWEPVSESILEGSHLQIVVPDLDLVHFVESPVPVVVRPGNGLCAAVVGESGEWEVLDVITGEVARLGRTGSFRWLSAAGG